LNFSPIDPIKALYWSAVINGVLAAPVMIMLMLLVRRPRVMGEHVVTGLSVGSAGPRPSRRPRHCFSSAFATRNR